MQLQRLRPEGFTNLILIVLAGSEGEATARAMQPKIAAMVSQIYGANGKGGFYVEPGSQVDQLLRSAMAQANAQQQAAPAQPPAQPMQPQAAPLQGAGGIAPDTPAPAAPGHVAPGYQVAPPAQHAPGIQQHPPAQVSPQAPMMPTNADSPPSLTEAPPAPVINE